MPTSDDLPKEAILDLIDSIQSQLERLRGLVQPRMEGFDTKDSRNKLPDGKLTTRGIEICYRLFDQGKTRYAVKEEMGISYGAATHRLEAWKKSGGVNRKKTPIDWSGDNEEGDDGDKGDHGDDLNPTPRPFPWLRGSDD